MQVSKKLTKQLFKNYFDEMKKFDALPKRRERNEHQHIQHIKLSASLNAQYAILRAMYTSEDFNKYKPE